ncbi:MAG: hypothetical protein AAGE61_18635, partial [Pseudomonadota bacterium]
SMEEAWEFRLILAVSFVLCLIYAMLTRLMPRSGQAAQTGLPTGHRPATSIFAEARSAAYAAAGYACQR